MGKLGIVEKPAPDAECNGVRVKRVVLERKLLGVSFHPSYSLFVS
jgi:hypothetical protein